MFLAKFLAPLEPNSSRERVVVGASLSLACLVILLDQLTKAMVEHKFALHESLSVIDNYFNLFYVRNFGAAWSILSGYGWFLLLVAALVMFAIIWFFRYLTEGWIERYFSIFFIIGGIVGNSIDRIWRGAVVDFLDFHYHEVYHWPVFNIADVAICIGVGIFVLSSILRRSQQSVMDSEKGNHLADTNSKGTD